MVMKDHTGLLVSDLLEAWQFAGKGYKPEVTTLNRLLGLRLLGPETSQHLMYACEQEGFAPGTTRKLYSVLKRVAKWRFDGVPYPFNRVTLPPIKRKIRVLSPDECCAYLDTFHKHKGTNEYLWWLAMVLYYTGARLQEALGILHDDIKGGTLTIYRYKTKSKTKMELHPRLRRFYGGWETPSEFIIPYKARNEVVYQYRKELDLTFNQNVPREDRVTPHTIRHTFATAMLGQGHDMAFVSYLLGHSSIKQTQEYAKIVNNKTLEERAKGLWTNDK